MAADTNLPTYRSPAYGPMEKRWTRIRDVRYLQDLLDAAAEQTIRPNAGALPLQSSNSTLGKLRRYLPSFEAEEAGDYQTRISLTKAYDALEQTIGALVGLVFRADPQLSEDAHPKIILWWDNLDGAGKRATQLLPQSLELAIQDGHSCLLVECPPGRGEGELPLSDLEAERTGIRPYVCVIEARQILNWDPMERHGQKILGQVTIQEEVTERKGAFGRETFNRYRVYRQQFEVDGTAWVELELWRDPPGGTGDPVRDGPARRIKGPQYIPLFPIYGGTELDLLESRPPLEGLATSSLEHTQVKSDRRISLHKCAIPVPIFVGRVGAVTAPGVPGAGGDVVMSSSRGIDISLGGNAFYLEPNGAALPQLKEELEAIEARMGSQGMAMLKRQGGGEAETATFHAMDYSWKQSKLGRAVLSLSVAVDQVLGAMAAYAGLEAKTAGVVSFRRDLSKFGLGVASLQFLSSLEEKGQLTIRTLLLAIKGEGIIPEGVDIDDEVARLQEQRAPESMGLGLPFGGGKDPAGRPAPGTEPEKEPVE